MYRMSGAHVMLIRSDVWLVFTDPPGHVSLWGEVSLT